MTLRCADEHVVKALFAAGPNEHDPIDSVTCCVGHRVRRSVAHAEFPFIPLHLIELPAGRCACRPMRHTAHPSRANALIAGNALHSDIWKPSDGNWVVSRPSRRAGRCLRSNRPRRDGRCDSGWLRKKHSRRGSRRMLPGRKNADLRPSSDFKLEASRKGSNNKTREPAGRRARIKAA
jgi:hypothetical protein